MTDRILSRQFHGTKGAEAWRVLPDGAYAFFRWDEAESRVASGVAAGGRIVRHNAEEGFWTLADLTGNEVDIATTSAPGPAE